jgi:hypothetical protein
VSGGHGHSSDDRRPFRYHEHFTKRLYSFLSTLPLPRLLLEATIEEDMRQGFDFIVMAEQSPIAVRCRNNLRPNVRRGVNVYTDVTIRSRTRWGRVVELDKMRRKAVKFYFYCWCQGDARNEDAEIVNYMLYNVHTVVDSGLLEGHLPETLNKSDGTGFVKLNIVDLQQADAIVKTTWPIPKPRKLTPPKPVQEKLL